jgi:hypothetical protein
MLKRETALSQRNINGWLICRQELVVIIYTIATVLLWPGSRVQECMRVILLQGRPKSWSCSVQHNWMLVVPAATRS